VELRDPATGRYLTFAPQFWLQWHLTDRCDGQCRHCYVTARRPDLPADAQRIILDRYLGFLRRRGQPGRLQLAGGEPLLAPGLERVLDVAATEGIPARVLTGGRPVTPERAADLAARGVKVVQVSVEGTVAQHEALRGPGSHAVARAACERLTAAGIEVTVASTVHAGNPGALAALRRDFHGLARRVHGARLVPVGRAEHLEAPLLGRRAWRAEMRAAVVAPVRPGAPELLLKDPTWVGLTLGGREACDLPTVGGCSAGYAGLCVDTDGTAYPCRRLPVPVGNLLTDEIEDVLAHPLMVALRDRDRLQGRCGRCGLRWQCGGCRAVAAAVHGGEPLAEDPQCPWPWWRRLGRVRDLAR
jgi:radical SAM protein with 4Fe4S-binding SPASM domain